MLGLSSNLTQNVVVFLYICVFVHLYLCICICGVRHLGTLFLRSSCHLVFKNISNHESFQGFHGRDLCGANKWDGMGWMDGISVWGYSMSTALRC